MVGHERVDELPIAGEEMSVNPRCSIVSVSKQSGLEAVRNCGKASKAGNLTQEMEGRKNSYLEKDG
jgi:hypothetical protein